MSTINKSFSEYLMFCRRNELNPSHISSLDKWYLVREGKEVF